MASLGEMYEVATGLAKRKEGFADSLGDFGAAVGEGYVGMQDIQRKEEDRKLDRALKYMELRAKNDESRLFNETMNFLSEAKGIEDRGTAFQNLGAGAVAGTEGPNGPKVDNTESSRLGSMLSTPTGKTRRGMTMEVGISGGKPSVNVKVGDPKTSTVDQMLAIKNYIDKEDPAPLATAFPEGIPDWATKYMAMAKEAKIKSDAIRTERQTVKRDTRVKEMRSEIVKSKPYEGYREISGFVKGIENAVQNPGAFGDLNILFDYMRSLDPTSVVREGEQQMFRATGSLSTKAANSLNRLVSGESLQPEQREEILRYAKNRQKVAKGQYDTFVKPYHKQAGRLSAALDEIDPLVGEEEPEETAKPKTSAPPTVSSQEQYDALPKGSQYVDPEGIVKVKK